MGSKRVGIVIIGNNEIVSFRTDQLKISITVYTRFHNLVDIVVVRQFLGQT